MKYKQQELRWVYTGCSSEIGINTSSLCVDTIYEKEWIDHFSHEVCIIWGTKNQHRMRKPADRKAQISPAIWQKERLPDLCFSICRSFSGGPHNISAHIHAHLHAHILFFTTTHIVFGTYIWFIFSIFSAKKLRTVQPEITRCPRLAFAHTCFNIDRPTHHTVITMIYKRRYGWQCEDVFMPPQTVSKSATLSGNVK